MSLIFSADEGWIISHLRYLNDIYKSVRDDRVYCGLIFNNVLFDINSQYLRQNQITQTIQDEGMTLQSKIRKRKRSKLLPQEDLMEINHIKETFFKIMASAKAERLFCNDVTSDNNEAARLVSQKFYQDTFHNEEENFYGSNDTDVAIISEANNKKYVFPKRCSFYCYDVRDITKKMELNNQYDFILLDPPWWNKSIRRKKTKHVEAR